MSKGSATLGVSQQVSSRGTAKSDYRFTKDLRFIGLGFISVSGHGSPTFADPPTRCSIPSNTCSHRTPSSGGKENPCKGAKIVKKTILGTALALTIMLLPTSAAAAENVKYCGHSASGKSMIVAGNNPPRYPKTSCEFARAAFRKLVKQTRQDGGVNYSFRIRVNGKRLNGSAFPYGGLLIITMRNWGRYIQVATPF